MGKSRGYVFTINNWTDDDLTAVKSLVCKYCICGDEVGEQGTRHLQGYVYFQSPRSFKAVSKQLKRAYLKAAKGTSHQNWLYCTKQETIWEYGQQPKQGKRNDLQYVVKRI